MKCKTIHLSVSNLVCNNSITKFTQRNKFLCVVEMAVCREIIVLFIVRQTIDSLIKFLALVYLVCYSALSARMVSSWSKQNGTVLDIKNRKNNLMH